MKVNGNGNYLINNYKYINKKEENSEKGTFDKKLNICFENSGFYIFYKIALDNDIFIICNVNKNY